MAIESWSMCRVHGTWMDAEGNRLSGSVATTISARVTNTADDTIIPAGRYMPGCLKLSTSASALSLDFQCPATDDPDIPEAGWGVTIVVTFDDPRIKSETYVLDAIPSGGVIDLRPIIPNEVPSPLGVASLKLGRPGGVALLNASGAVVDANGTPVTPAATPNITAEVVGTGEPAVEVVGTYPNLKFAFTLPATSGTVDPTPLGRLAHIGDSLTHRAGEENVTAWYRGVGLDAQVYGVDGKQINNPDSSGKTTVQNVIDMRASGVEPAVWVIALGQNLSDESAMRAGIDAVCAEIDKGGAKKIAWVGTAASSTINTYETTGDSYFYWINQMIKDKMAARGQNGLFVDIWNWTIANRPDKLDNGAWFVDGIHMTPAGYLARYGYITNTVAQWVR